MDKIREPKWVFQEGKEEYTVKEFFRKFRDKLPVLAMVTQGYCGSNFFEDIPKGEAFRVHTYSRQKRVIADVLKSENALLGRKLSIPLDFRLLFRPTKGNKRDLPLKKIVEDNRLPITVTSSDHPANDPLEVDGINWRASDVTFRLHEVYDDIYLLGNTISEYFLYQRVLAVPLYMTELRIALIKDVKGFEGGVVEYMRRTSNIVETHIVFDRQTGNDNIYIYGDWHMQRENEYTYIAPNQYYNIPSRFSSSDQRSDDVIKQANRNNVNLYEIIPKNLHHLKMTSRSSLQPDIHRGPRNDYQGLPRQRGGMSENAPLNPTPNKNPPNYTNDRNFGGRVTAHPDTLIVQKTEPPPLPPRSKATTANTTRSQLPLASNSRTESHLTKYNEKSNKEYVDQPRQSWSQGGAVITDTKQKESEKRDKTYTPRLSSGSDFTSAQTHLPSSDMHFRELTQQIKQRSAKVPTTGMYYDKLWHAKSKENVVESSSPSKTENTKARYKDHTGRPISASDVSSMTITEVCDWLCKLKLGQHTSVFVDNLIDGCILADLDVDDLMYELGMKRYEAIKLRKFVTDGYLPKM